MRLRALRTFGRTPRRPTPDERDPTASRAPRGRVVVLFSLVLALAAPLVVSSAASEPIRARVAWTRTTQQADAGWIEVTELPGLRRRLVTPRSHGVSRRFDTQAAWAPSGNKLAFTRRNAGAASGVYVVTTGG